jgi:CPA1 family monovalent cation:H+ antiporter
MLRLPPPNIAQELAERGNLLAEVRAAGEAELGRVAAEGDPADVVDQLRRAAQFHGAVDALPIEPDVEHPVKAYQRLRMAMIQAERAAVLQARRENRYQEPAILAVLASIDAEETALRMAEK